MAALWFVLFAGIGFFAGVVVGIKDCKRTYHIPPEIKPGEIVGIVTCEAE